jgi:MFS transporter, MHS family, proline/betaine transporter
MNKKNKTLLSSGVANTFEWYDYALFGNFAPLIGRKFFPASDASSSMLKVFLVFAVGYLMRPLGGIFFGIIGDKMGRRFALSFSIVCMSVPIAIIGFLPTYEEIGFTSSVLMVVMRMLQGLSVGGALTGSISFLIEHTNKNSRGAVGSIPMLSICLGILLGTGVSMIIQNMMSAEDFDDYGWRIPFVIGVVTAFAGFYINKHTEETPMFKDLKKKGAVLDSPIKKVFSKNWFDMLVSIMINSTGSVMFYFQAVYISNYLKTKRGFSPADVDKLGIICFMIMTVTCVISGMVSDIIGRKRTFVAIIIIAMLSIFNITHTLQYGDWSSVIMAQIFLGILAAFYIGPEPALQAEFYPTNIRSTALSISYNVSTSVFGGTAPYVIEYLYSRSNDLSGCGNYVIITSVFSLIGLYYYKNRMDAPSKPIK